MTDVGSTTPAPATPPTSTPSPLSAPTPPAAEAPVTPSTNPTDTLYPEVKPEVKPEVTPEAKPEDKKPETPEAKPEEKKADDKAPALELKLPEGAEATEALGSFTTFATEAGLDQTKAQALLDMHFAEMKKVTDGSMQAFQNTLTEWAGKISADPELGGDKAPVVASTIARALDEYGSTEARAAFDTTGAGWNPDIVRFVYKMASALSEGKPVLGGGPSARKAGTPSERLYGSTT